MDLVTLCPFVASKLVWRAPSGVFALTVIVKATFLLQPGTSKLAPDQEPISEHDQFHDNDPRRSVRIPNDLVPHKPRADVLLIGRAYAPGNQPVRNLVTRFVVGDVDKSIEVWCDRAFRVLDGALLEGKRFTEMPLTWERAAGGPDSANPVGKRFDGAPDTYGTIAIANLQPMGHFVSKRSDTFVPTCYAPIAATWPERIRRLGPLSRGIFEGRWQDKPLPQDFEPTYFLAAPHDQHVPEIRASERIIMENLHADHPRLVTNLPGLKPRAIADRATGEREEITLVGDTLWVDSDRGVCCVVWRGRIGLRHPQEAGRIAVWVDGLPMAGSESASGQTPEIAKKVANLKATLDSWQQSASTAPVLPFAAGSSNLSPLGFGAKGAEGDPKPQMFNPEILTSNSNENDRLGPTLNVAGIPALPLEYQAPKGSQLKLTMEQPYVSPRASPLPFNAPSDSRPPVMPEDPYTFGPTEGSGAKSAEGDAKPPMFNLAFSEPIDAPSGFPVKSAEGDVKPPMFNAGGTSSVPVEPTHLDVAPPAMMGPLAKVDIGPEVPAPIVVVWDKPAPAEEPTPAKEVVEPPVVELPLEKTATIAAELAEGHMDRARVFDFHELDERAWKKNEERWKAAIEDEQGRGKTALRATYDAAYVKRVEGFRGAITVKDYARILVAIERRKATQVLQELKIQQPAQMPIIRIWVKKVAQNRGLGDEMADALKAARNNG